MEKLRTDSARLQPSEAGFWMTVGTAIAGLARRAGCSGDECPLPEIREAFADLRDWDGSAPADERPIAA